MRRVEYTYRTLTEVAGIMGVSKQYAQKLESNALAKLRRGLRNDPVLIQIAKELFQREQMTHEEFLDAMLDEDS